MANIGVIGDELRIELRPSEKVGALHGSIEVPLAAIESVEVVEDPFAEIKGTRAPGTAAPGAVAIGTWRGPDNRDFVVAYRRERGLVFTLRNEAYDHLIVSCQDPERVLALINVATQD